MKIFDTKRKAISFLTEIILEENKPGTNTRNALRDYYKKENPDATCEDLLNLDAVTARKIRNVGKKGYVLFCEYLKGYELPLGFWPIFSLYDSLKDWKPYEGKLTITQRRRKALKDLIDTFTQKMKDNVSDEKQAERLLYELKKLILS